ncbi:DUF4177 domain-containing protein [Xinfangfangia sp. CPCC 101601]|uniref:DUF4177 domain-containing protein n=1 Tax=Pseudogemmobacter lacusdianii TaxID=3069608 RepID=A0ABU0W0T6_9RHOB|nr:DUF4177 domain-containing protein [Xinfangfangia sp. CPCC 101601]MDQ2067574.1 DUF4177 domain-containing protein [Xinfangfangia sp. CPCC 101601]
MQRYEYHIVPAPRRGEKARGVKTTEDRFALALMGLMNRLGAEGWEYVRADALPCDERSGLTGTKTTYQNMLVFRRVIESAVAVAPVVASPVAVAPVVDAPAPALRLGAADAPAGAAPSLGAAKPEQAAE